MVNNMGFDRFSFMVTLINEVENEVINRRSLGKMVACLDEDRHPPYRLDNCQTEIWFCGRCWCNNPWFRWFDQFGRARLRFL
ncbi:unnamed protein product [Laminaria digitata]